MAKRRSCRRTAHEDRIHEKAVKMRKMTDEQLVHYVEDRVEKARNEGFNQGKKQAPAEPSMKVEDFISEVSQIKGIGCATIWKIKDYYKKKEVLRANGETDL